MFGPGAGWSARSPAGSIGDREEAGCPLRAGPPDATASNVTVRCASRQVAPDSVVPDAGVGMGIGASRAARTDGANRGRRAATGPEAGCGAGVADKPSQPAEANIVSRRRWAVVTWRREISSATSGLRSAIAAISALCSS